MNSKRPVNPRLNEDLRFEVEPGGPPRYHSTTEKPVHYLTVADAEGRLIGYVWANDEDDAAGWVTRKAGGPPAFNEGILWATWLHDAKERGIAPTAALAEMVRASGAGGIGNVVSGSVAQAPNVAAVVALADQS